MGQKVLRKAVGVLTLLSTSFALAGEFLNLCEGPDTSAADRKTVEVLIAAVGGQDCVETDEILQQTSSLSLRNRGISSLRAFRALPALEELDLRENSGIEKYEDLLTLPSLAYLDLSD